MGNLAGVAFGSATLFFACAVPAQLDWSKARIVERGTQLAMAHDSARQRTILFGTEGGNSTWEWDGVRWAPRASPQTPSLSGASLAYDSGRRRAVLLSWPSSATALPETWEWDGQAWVLRNQTGPSPRTGVATYDSARQRVLLFGGSGGETWEWDGSSWLQRFPVASPSVRYWTAIVYDSARQRVVLHGGLPQSSSSPSTETWEWDGTVWTKSLVQGPARESHGLAYDTQRQRVVLFGGRDASELAETWEYDGVTWTRRSPGVAPPARRFHAMAYDAARQRVVVHGGQGYGPLGDTWEYDGSTWIQAARVPEPRSEHAAAYDSGRDRVVMFGGGFLAPDVWEWDGTRWEVQPTGLKPGSKQLHALAYDPIRRRTVMFGGYGPAETWEWDGTSWFKASPPVQPEARIGGVLVYDPVRQRTVLFGGLYPTSGKSETWEWDGSTWTQRQTAVAPLYRGFAAAAYDAARQQIVIVGGTNGAPYPDTKSYQDTWVWDGQSWTQKATALSPPASGISNPCAYDPVRRRVVLLTGTGTWEWDGTSWTQLATPSSPNCMGALVWEGARRRMLLAGSNATLTGTTWLLGASNPAKSTSLGSGCGGASGTPALAGGVPFLGNSGFAVDLLSARAGAACAFVLAGATQTLALGGGCTLYVKDPLIALPGTTNGTGFASTGIAIPPDPSLRGGVAWFQAAVQEASGPFGGLSLTGGLAITIGD